LGELTYLGGWGFNDIDPFSPEVMGRPRSTEAVQFGANSTRIAFLCDHALAETIHCRAAEEKHESASRVIRRWLRAGAKSEGVNIYGE
jgi:hypothetical protein